ncbi:hypothetical protein BC939DRAFT_40034 [Gamsiella multidivaricata]|uniref:uncharacterized protein n=1 Tax=Gamsiella multidivaricata TaxID=101098 RepID=UPI00221F2A3E|nr:uncharacterized protein BC939DRAFT_40034 [Gamsiella multidivaricata]KAI7829003.1 hypothetical protein BC939DRAFT_40034 [Gamsiella multidivaricata]
MVPAPRTPQPPARLSLASHPPGGSPRFHLPQSPANSSLRRSTQYTPLPFAPTGATVAYQLPSNPNVTPMMQVPYAGNAPAVIPLGHGYQRTPLPGVIPASTCNMAPAHTMPPPPPPPFQSQRQQPEYLKRPIPQAYPPLNAAYTTRVMASVGQPPGQVRMLPISDSSVEQDHLIRSRSSASSARTTWQQQKQQQMYQQQQYYPTAVAPPYLGPSTLSGIAVPTIIRPPVTGRSR